MSEKDPKDPRTLTLVARPGEEPSAVLANAHLRPNVQAAVTVYAFNSDAGLTIDTLVAELKSQCDTASAGDFARSEAMLTAQAHTLDTVFNFCARRACANVGKSYQATELYMRLGLKAQSQCRATLQALVDMKNPRPMAFVQQANIAAGPQQVNNGPAAMSGARGRETQNPPSKLLERNDGERLDAGTTGEASQANTAMETLGAVDRTEDG